MPLPHSALPLVLVHGPVRTSSLSCVEVESVHVIVLSLRVRTLPASLYASTGFNVQSTKVEALYKFMRTRRHRQTHSQTHQSLSSVFWVIGDLACYYISCDINALSSVIFGVLKRDIFYLMPYISTRYLYNLN
jgi:hypothetical protein